MMKIIKRLVVGIGILVSFVILAFPFILYLGIVVPIRWTITGYDVNTTIDKCEKVGDNLMDWVGKWMDN